VCPVLVVLFCQKCGEGFRSGGSTPTTCPCCEQATTWDAQPLARAWELTLNDKRFLHGLKILAD
jgi:hypothetical protein